MTIKHLSQQSGLCCLLFLFAVVPSPQQLAQSKLEPPPSARKAVSTKSSGYIARMETDRGTIEIELFPNDAPKAVKNFRFLAMGGHYNGLTFHRIIKGFMIQGGDPKGDGSGGESIWGGSFEDEIDPNSALYQKGYRRGIVAMANAGPNTNGSQFFIMHQDYRLPPKYVIIGQVIRGMEVVDAIANVPTTLGDDGHQSKPVSPVMMRKVTIHAAPGPAAGSGVPR
jgi:cyclophilin family peptidyl-prolyl cis-trans isomerase